MEHIEQAGVHSRRLGLLAAAVLAVASATVDELKRQTAAMAKALNVVGLMNVQFAIQGDGRPEDVVYVLEVNPRASRTVPFVSKATGQAAGQDRRALHGRPVAGRPQGISHGSDAAVLQRQGSRVPVHQVPGRGPHPRPRR